MYLHIEEHMYIYLSKGMHSKNKKIAYKLSINRWMLQ